ncbi:BQ2448_2825 [Microbotryum intermedium]|uniref:BQ2448_2825 protein n=1 Tax=Microbotryum intermedium TaxID=269621 RepID=A0A238FDH4_9BASI|nr:BQ2448_2825 [Microbotryum intermedium]
MMQLSPTLFITNPLPQFGYSWSQLQRTIYYDILTWIDSVLFVLNLIPFTSKPADDVVPKAFSPDRPPSLVHMPVAWAMCALAKMAPTQVSESEFVKQWSRWTGIGHAGHWKTSFAPPHFPGGDSRCPCPALNAMANHGILPRNGRRITPDMLISRLARTYNLAPTIAAQLLFPFKVLYEDRGWFDLEDIGAQGLVQHDGSLLREDNNSEYAAATNVANQASPSQRLINRYFPESMDPFDWHDHARVLS